jgi:hypothetical protein
MTRKKLFLILAASAATSALALSAARARDVPKVATGFVANVICTETFVSGLDPARVLAETTAAMPGTGLITWAMDYRVDRARKDVTVTLFGLGRSHAVWRGEGLGCYLDHGGAVADISLPAADAKPALLPDMMRLWSLNNSEAGWITAIFYGTYILAVPILVTLTDRIDAKRVYLAGVAATVLGLQLQRPEDGRVADCPRGRGYTGRAGPGSVISGGRRGCAGHQDSAGSGTIGRNDSPFSRGGRRELVAPIPTGIRMPGAWLDVRRSPPSLLRR